MNFKQALEALISGKKIRRTCWKEGNYWHLNERGQIVNSIGKNPIISKYHILDRDTWQVMEEPINDSIEHELTQLQKQLKELESKARYWEKRFKELQEKNDRKTKR